MGAGIFYRKCVALDRPFHLPGCAFHKLSSFHFPLFDFYRHAQNNFGATRSQVCLIFLFRITAGFSFHATAAPCSLSNLFWQKVRTTDNFLIVFLLSLASYAKRYSSDLVWSYPRRALICQCRYLALAIPTRPCPAWHRPDKISRRYSTPLRLTHCAANTLASYARRYSSDLVWSYPRRCA